MTFEEALAYLDSYRDMGSFYELETVQGLLQILGNPQDKLEIIHIAGTNGKGSTVAFLSAILKQAGYPVGTYTSPSVYAYLERFTYHGKPLDEKIFAAITSQVAQAASDMEAMNMRHPTIFEMELAIAYLGALHTDCTVFIQETGLGGRLDATNIIENPILTVITAISLDHQAELGHTLEAVTREKAGILKPASPLVAYCNPPVVNNILKHYGNELEIPMEFIDCDALEIDETSRLPQRFRYRKDRYEINLLGTHQLYNALLAIRSALTLATRGYAIKQRDIQEGLRQARWPGRFEILSTNPTVVLDGAHNPQAAQVLAENLDNYFPDQTCRAVVHIFKDKDAAGILAPFSKYLTQLYVTTTSNPRSLSEKELAKIAAPYFPSASISPIPHLSEAIRKALEDSAPEDVLLIFGSLSHLAEAVATLHVSRGDNSHDQSEKS